MISRFSIGNVGDAARYHDKAFSQDGAARADNYYLDEQAAAHWEGRGAEIIGISGQPVERDDFVAFLEGKLPNPANGETQDLSANSRGADRRAGEDFTVSAPKSVSIVALAGQDERVVAAHLSANKRAIGWLEEHAAVVRVRQEGRGPEPVQAKNLLYATVMHETNRANEPQLHNHNVIVAAVYDENSQKWRSLTNDQLYKLRAQADIVYKSELAHGLRRAGYDLEYGKNGVDFEIKGFTEKQLETYSSRSEQIKAALVARGYDPENASYAARQTAALDSRATKQDVPKQALHEVWQATAREAGLDIVGLVDRARNRPPLEIEATADRTSAVHAVTWAVEHLAEREQSFKVTDIATTALKFDSKASIDQVERAIAEQVRNSQLISREQDSAGAVLMTTAKGLEAERELAGNISAGKEQGRVVLADAAEFDRAVLAFNVRKSQETGSDFKLSAEQVSAAKNVLMHPDTYQGIQGEAGTGKTAALDMVRQVAEDRGWQVKGMATSASAAKELQTASGIQSVTVAGFFVERDNALRATKHEITTLEAALAKRGEEPNRLERKTLTIETPTVSLPEARYAFNHQKGEVYKSANNFSNLLGNFFLDVADAGRAVAERGNDRPGGRRADVEVAAHPLGPGAPVVGQKLSTRLRANALNMGIGAADYLGQSLTQFEQVGTVEAALARSSLYLNREPSRDPLLRDLDLKRAELHNLATTGNREGRKTLLVMDEASLTGARDAAKVSALASSINARVVFQGDTKQHRSVPAGRAFGQAQQLGMNTSLLEETRRFDKATEQVKSALQDMKAGRFQQAIGRLDHVAVPEQRLAAMVAERYVTNLRELRDKGVADPQVGIVAVTNHDRKQINVSVHALFVQNGTVGNTGFDKLHLDAVKLTDAERTSAAMLKAHGVDRLVFRQNYRELQVQREEVVKVVRFDVENNRIVGQNARGKQITINPMKQERFTAAKEEIRSYAAGSRIEARSNIDFEDKLSPRVSNGSRGTVQAITAEGATVKWHDGVTSKLNNRQLQLVDHSYARTTYKEQGATNHREIIAISQVGAKVFNREAAYVAVSRAKDNTEIVTSDLATLQKNAAKDVTKSIAAQEINVEQIVSERRQRTAVVHPEKQSEQTRNLGQALSF